MLLTVLLLTIVLALCPFPPLARKCQHCGKMRPPVSWITSLDKSYCDDCLDVQNKEIRDKKSN